MSKREEDFHNKAEKYANECGGTTQEKCAIITDYCAGCEHGYQYTVKKACKWLSKHAKEYVCVICDGNVTSVTYENENLIDDFHKAMKE